MNVMEQVLRERIDPFLIVENLSLLGSRALGREVRALSSRILTGGCWNRVISVAFEGESSELVFKINPKSGNEQIEREFRVLEYFSVNTDMPVPVPCLLDTSGDIIPGSLLAMKKIPGSVLHGVFGLLDSQARNTVSEQIGHFVGQLHGKTSIGFGGVELDEERRESVWSDFWLPRFDNVFKEIAGKNLVAPDFLAQIEAVRRNFAAYLDIGRESTLTHYDIWSGNIMVAGNGDSIEVSGFIDIPGYWADYARELSFMEVFGSADPVFYSVYATYRSLDPGFRLRKNIYQLRTHLKHITMYPDQPYYRQGAQRNLLLIKSAG